MHRSGTSALAGAISNLGFFSGETWEPDCNDKNGYFENKNITLALDEYFESVNYSWDDSRKLPIDFQNHPKSKHTS